MKVSYIDVLSSCNPSNLILQTKSALRNCNNNNEWYFVSYFQAVSDVQEGMSHMLASMATGTF